MAAQYVTEQVSNLVSTGQSTGWYERSSANRLCFLVKLIFKFFIESPPSNMPSGISHVFGVLVPLCVLESFDVILSKVVRSTIWLGLA